MPFHKSKHRDSPQADSILMTDHSAVVALSLNTNKLQVESTRSLTVPQSLLHEAIDMVPLKIIKIFSIV